MSDDGTSTGGVIFVIGRIGLLGVTAVGTLALASPAVAGPSGTVFTGAGRGLTAEVAIQGAIDDAQVSASAEELFSCTQVGAPRIFETFTDPYFGHLYRAEVDLACTA